MTETPSRLVSPEAHDDSLLPFAVEPLDLRGRLVRLGPTVNAILKHYDYPEPVARLLGEGKPSVVRLKSPIEGKTQVLDGLRGEVEFEGRRYLVTRGSLDFANANRIQPFFDIEAETRVRVFKWRVSAKV